MRFALCSLVALSCAFAQVPLPELKIDAITAGSVLFVRNPSAQPLVAYVIELVDYPGSSFALWQDEWVNGGPIVAGADRRIQITNMTVGAVPDYVKVRAAIYADGSTVGVPERVALLTGRRKAQLEIAMELIKRLEAGEDVVAWAETLKPEGKPKNDSAAWVNRAAQYALVSAFKGKSAADVRRSVESH